MTAEIEFAATGTIQTPQNCGVTARLVNCRKAGRTARAPTDCRSISATYDRTVDRPEARAEFFHSCLISPVSSMSASSSRRVLNT